MPIKQKQPVWDQSVEFDEIADEEDLKIKCLSDDNIGTGHVSLEGLVVICTRNVVLL